MSDVRSTIRSGDGVTEAECRRLVKGRAEGSCERCGRNYPPATLHHRLKRSQAPKTLLWSPGNAGMLCGHGTSRNACHSWVEHNADAAEIEGWHVRPWGSPGEIAVLYRGEWKLLTEDGEVIDAAFSG